MDVTEFREFGKAAIEFIGDYLENIRERYVKLGQKTRQKSTIKNVPMYHPYRPVLPSVQPGYLQDLIPTEMPEKPESWKDIMKDLNRCILPGLTNWQSPNFHAFYPAHISYSSIIGEMISASFGIIGFSWVRTSSYRASRTIFCLSKHATFTTIFIFFC